MKKKRIVRRTHGEDIEARLTRLETDMAYVRQQIENHIPHTLEAHGKMLENIQRRMGDTDAISRFLSICLKGVGIMAGAVWSIKSIFHGGK